MRNLNVSDVSASIGLPVKSGTLIHLQLAYKEALAGIAKAITGYGYDPTKVYILNGCVNSGSGSNYDISAGAVFFNGEVYLVDAVAFSVSGPNVAVGVITKTYFTGSNADPVQFTDGITRTIHEIYKIVPQAGLSGSGAGNFTDWVELNLNTPILNLTGTGIADVTGAYPDINIDVPAPTPPYLAKDITHIGDVFGGSNPADAHAIVFDTPLSTNAYMIIGSIISNSGAHPQESSITFSTYAYTTAGFTVHFNEYAAGVQDISFAWIAVPL
jgi:hypothetical protein